MKITNPNGAAIGGVGKDWNKPTAIAPASPAGRFIKPDDIQLSNLSAYLAAQSTESPVQAAKLQVLTAAVASDGYQVDAQVVSQSIINNALSFNNAGYA